MTEEKWAGSLRAIPPTSSRSGAESIASARGRPTQPVIPAIQYTDRIEHVWTSWRMPGKVGIGRLPAKCVAESPGSSLFPSCDELRGMFAG